MNLILRNTTYASRNTRYVQSKMPALRLVHRSLGEGGSPQGEEGNDYAKQSQFTKSRK
jgi:hypothetical protein